MVSLLYFQLIMCNFVAPYIKTTPRGNTYMDVADLSDVRNYIRIPVADPLRIENPYPIHNTSQRNANHFSK